ncbi:MAG: M23 family metallopeptidase [Rickettsiales bacterium]|nr:M23 family metallopeptidase [Rickettsiales bacterium]
MTTTPTLPAPRTSPRSQPPAARVQAGIDAPASETLTGERRTQAEQYLRAQGLLAAESPDETQAQRDEAFNSAYRQYSQNNGLGGAQGMQFFMRLLMMLFNPDFDAELGRVATPQDNARDREAGVSPGQNSPDSRAVAERATGAVRRYLEENAGTSPVAHTSPVLGESRVTSGFGMRDHPVVGGRAHHAGIDLARPSGSGESPAIGASARGIVEFSGEMRGYGNVVIIRHPDGGSTRYGHLASISVVAGQVLAQGERLGVMGTTGRSTGIHLHYEQRDASGTARDPVINGTALAVGQRLSPGTAIARPQAPSVAEGSSSIPASVREQATGAALPATSLGARPDVRADAAGEAALGNLNVSNARAATGSGTSRSSSSSSHNV